VVFSVSGDAFLRGQVRKLVGLALAITRGWLPEWYLDVAIKSRTGDSVCDIPSVPKEGLSLAECRYVRTLLVLYSTLLYSTLLYSTLLYSTLLCFTSLLFSSFYRLYSYEEQEASDFLTFSLSHYLSIIVRADIHCGRRSIICGWTLEESSLHCK
jgi:tRNA pseudouridine synthase